MKIGSIDLYPPSGDLNQGPRKVMIEHVLAAANHFVAPAQNALEVVEYDKVAKRGDALRRNPTIDQRCQSRPDMISLKVNGLRCQRT